MIIMSFIKTISTIALIGSGTFLQKAIEVGMKNSPGLSCRTIDLAMVYGDANLASRVLGRTQNFIAVTGKDVNGFYPVITGSGVKGWVMVNQTYPENSYRGPCRVQYLPDGRLLFGWP